MGGVDRSVLRVQADLYLDTVDEDTERVLDPALPKSAKKGRNIITVVLENPGRLRLFLSPKK